MENGEENICVCKKCSEQKLWTQISDLSISVACSYFVLSTMKMRRNCCCRCHYCWFSPHFLLLVFFLIVRCNCLIIDFWHISSQKRPATVRPVLIPLQWSVMLCEHALVRVPLKIGSGAKHYILQRVLSVHCVLSPFVPFLLMRRIGFLWALSFVQSHSKPFLVRVCESLFCCLISFEFFFWCSSHRFKWIKSNFDFV